MNHERVAQQLSRGQRRLLLAHIDGAVDVPAVVFATMRGNFRQSMMTMGLIVPDQRNRPRITTITENGRMVLAYVLAEYADGLVRAGYTGLASPVDVRPRPIAATEPAVLETV